MTVFNTTISNNSINIPGYNGGWTGGAGISNFDGIMTVFNCTIKENTASNHLTWSIDYPSAQSWGGGIMNYKSPPPNYLPTILSIFNSTISANEAYAESEDRRVYAHPYGGGAYFSDNAYITNCTFYNNRIRSAQNYDAKGPEVYLSGIPFFINNLFVTNQHQYTSVYNSNWMKGKGNLTNDTTFNNSDSTIVTWGYTSKELFGRDSVTLSNNGGFTETVPLAQNAVAIGKGTNAGYYSYDTILPITDFNIEGVIYKSAYYNGTEWISSETGNQVPDQIEVVGLCTDQRGRPRNDPPCVGAFEFTPGDSIPVNVKNKQTIKIEIYESFIVRNRLFIRSSSEVSAGIQLINLAGRIIFRRSIKLVPGINSVAVPAYAKGIVICRVTTQERLYLTLVAEPFGSAF